MTQSEAAAKALRALSEWLQSGEPCADGRLIDACEEWQELGYPGVRAPDRTEGSRESWGVSCDVALGLGQAAAKAIDAAAAVMPDGGPNAIGETVRRELFRRLKSDAESLLESIREEAEDYAAGGDS